MWGVILRSGHHPRVGSESQNNLCIYSLRSETCGKNHLTIPDYRFSAAKKGG